jgi:hypothetical protein
MELLTKQLRHYAAKVLQAADLLDDLGDLVPTTIPELPTTGKPKPARKPMSKAARHKIAVAQRKRWKLYKGGKAKAA